MTPIFFLKKNYCFSSSSLDDSHAPHFEKFAKRSSKFSEHSLKQPTSFSMSFQKPTSFISFQPSSKYIVLPSIIPHFMPTFLPYPLSTDDHGAFIEVHFFVHSSHPKYLWPPLTSSTPSYLPPLLSFIGK